MRVNFLIAFCFILLTGYSQRTITSSNTEVEVGEDQFKFLYVINESKKFEELPYLEIPYGKETTLQVMVSDMLSPSLEDCKLTWEFPIEFYYVKRIANNNVYFIFNPDKPTTGTTVRGTTVRSVGNRLVTREDTGITVGDGESYELTFIATNGRQTVKRATKLTVIKPTANNPPVIHGMECCIELCN